MTVTSSVARNDYLGNGGVAVYAFTFEVLAPADISVSVITTAGDTLVLAYGSDYTVALSETTRTGTITLSAGVLASGHKLSIVDNQPLTQLVDFEASNKYPPATIERAMDRVSMQLRTINEQLRHCVRLPASESPSAAILPLAAARANRSLAFDINGQPTTQGASLPTGIIVSSWAETLLNDLSPGEGRTTLGLGSLAVASSVNQSMLAADVHYRVDTIAALKALTTTYATVEVLGYYAAGDGGGGLFRWNSSDSTADNLGTVIIPNSAPGTGRWKRLFADFLNVMWFGAKGDGSTDDAPAFNAAIVIGGDIYAPKPTSSYRIPGTGSSQIKLLGNTRLVFEPGSTITTGAPSGFSRVLEINTANAATIENVTVEGNGLIITMDRTTAQVQYAININCQTVGNVLSNVHIRDVTLKDSRYDGFTIGGNAGAIPTRIYMERVVCTNNYRNGASIIQCDGFYATDCVFKGTNGTSPQAGFDVEPDVGCVARNINFTRCTFSGNASEGLYIQKGTGSGTDRGSIVDCVFEGNTGDGCKLYRITGFKMIGCTSRLNTGANVDGINIDDSDDIQLDNCASESNGGYGIRFTSVIGGLMSACRSKLNVLDGILLASTAGDLSRGSVTGCIVESNTGKGITLSGCSDIVVTDNAVIRNGGDGIVLTADTQQCTVSRNHVVENSATGDLNGDGIVVDTRSNYNTIAGNFVRKCLRFLRFTSTAGGASTITLPTTRVQVDSWYNGLSVIILSGTGSGQTRTISSYVGATGLMTVSAAWVTVPDATSVCEIIPANAFRQRYAVRINAGCTDNKVTDNDLLRGGGSGNLSDAGTGSVLTSGNRET